MFLSKTFFVIDWSGADKNGFPFYDLIRFSESFNLPDKKTKYLIKEWCRVLECDDSFSLTYLALALSRIYQNLEYFPEDLFKKMSTRLILKLNSLIC